MPHVEVRGARGVRAFHESFAPRQARDSGTILKANASYLGHDGRSLLVDCMTVEGRLRQGFFVLLTERSGGVMVRLLPRTSPEKTDGVKRLLVWLASWIRAGSPGAEFGATNLQEQIDAGLPPEVPEDGPATPGLQRRKPVPRRRA